MTDGRFYSILLLVLGVVAMVCVTAANIWQPPKVDVELGSRIFTFAAMVGGPLIVILNSNANKKELKQGQQEIKNNV